MKRMDWFEQALRNVLKKIWHYSGCKYIAVKMTFQKDKERYPTLPLWLLGLYVALFGLATQHYESHLDRFENKLNVYIAQLGTGARHQIFEALINHQRYKLPLEPVFEAPWITIPSLFGQITPISEQQSHSQKVREIAKIIIRFDNDISCNTTATAPSIKQTGFRAVCKLANLDRIILADSSLIAAHFGNSQLDGADFSNSDISNSSFYNASLIAAIFTNTRLTHTNFTKAELLGAAFNGAKLTSTLFNNANLVGADFTGASLKFADMQNAAIQNADLQGADLRETKNLTCLQLQQARNWQKAYRSPSLKCGANIPTTAK